MKFHILTAVSRVGNLNAVGYSIFAASSMAGKSVEFEWHKYPDFERQHVGGQHPKNVMLSEITDDWVCILDDDTTMHPKFLRQVYRAHRQNPHAPAIVVSQKRTSEAVAVTMTRPSGLIIG